VDHERIAAFIGLGKQKACFLPGGGRPSAGIMRICARRVNWKTPPRSDSPRGGGSAIRRSGCGRSSRGRRGLRIDRPSARPYNPPPVRRPECRFRPGDGEGV